MSRHHTNLDIPIDYHHHEPPGLLGELYRFIFQQSPYPIREVSIAGALALFAGIVGRQYNFSADGLNLYVLLVADTGMGKDAAKRGMSKIVTDLTKIRPAASQIMGPADFASGPALIKSIARRDKNPCFVCVAGEVGFKLQQMAIPKAPEHHVSLKRELLKLYTLSGKGGMLEAYEYADKRDSTPPVISPALTLLGEGTGDTIYKALDEIQITNGLISRFLIIEHKGLCPQYNKNHPNATISRELLENIDSLVAHIHDSTHKNDVTNVSINEDANNKLDEIREYCRGILNSKSGEVANNIWTRVAQKTQRLAALLAVAHNWREPAINIEMVQWVASLVIQDASDLHQKFLNGEMGEQDEDLRGQQIEAVFDVLRDYIGKGYGELPKNGATEEMHGNWCIPYSYIQRTVKRTPFSKDKIGTTRALRETLKELQNRGILFKNAPTNTFKLYGKMSETFDIRGAHDLLQ